jgi:mevalonate kinase
LEDFKEIYFSPGKLLITGEYLVIDGAKAFALPTKKGQWLKVNHNDSKEIHWTSLDYKADVWFEGRFNCNNFNIIESSDKEIAERLKTIFIEANKQDHDNKLNRGWDVTTALDFPNDWGLGSSSTLLCNIAKWLKIEPYTLHFSVSNGSGYDIACGMQSSPLLYSVQNKIPKIEKIDFNPIFKTKLYFVHLNQKQKSDIEVEKYSSIKKEIDITSVVNKITEITIELLQANDLPQFENLLKSHEQILSRVLQRETSQEAIFHLYNAGITKYLGAWGGDFIMISANSENDLEYFKNLGYQKIIPYADMIAD